MNIWGDFILLLFPEACLACRGGLLANEAPLCSVCRVSLPRTDYLKDSNNPVAQKFWGRLPLLHASAYLHFVKQGKAQQLIHALKYNGHQEVGMLLGKLYGYELGKAEVSPAFDLVLPVPLHKRKLQRRGFNQSDSFAQGLAEALELPWSASALIRTKATQTQTRKSRSERWENVAAIFELAQPEMVRGKHVLLVDDVLTTGATIEACGQALLAAGCAGLSVAAIAARG